MVKTMSMLAPHYFRHNFATQLYWAGIREMQAAAWMGLSESEIQKMTDYMNKLNGARCANDVPKQPVLMLAQ